MDKDKMETTQLDLKRLILDSRNRQISAEKTAEFIDDYQEQPANPSLLKESIRALDEDRHI